MPQVVNYLSADTKAMMDTSVEAAIVKAGSITQIDQDIIRAVIKQESGWVVTAIRYEPHLRKAEWYLSNLKPYDKTNDFAFCSMGLMQILYGTARAVGFEGRPWDLMDPTNSVSYGARYLGVLIKKHKSLEDAISSYNQGLPRKNAAGNYLNQDYVDRVMANLKYYRKLREERQGPPPAAAAQ